MYFGKGARAVSNLCFVVSESVDSHYAYPQFFFAPERGSVFHVYYICVEHGFNCFCFVFRISFLLGKAEIGAEIVAMYPGSTWITLRFQASLTGSL